MQPIVKVPAALTQAPHHQRALTAHDLTVVEACTHFEERRGLMYLQDHFLLFVLAGVYTVRHGGQQYVVRRGEMVLLRRAIQVEYHKTGEPARAGYFDCLMFFVQDDFVRDFVRRAAPTARPAPQPAPVLVRPVGEKMLGFLESIKPYFADAAVDTGLLRLKMLELLYNLAAADPSLLRQLLQLRRPQPTAIPAVVEAHIESPVSLADLAYLAGRSLSSFKRDFQAIYHQPPAQWLREQRLLRAQRLLQTTDLSVTDVCYSLGFESVAHFGRLFKRQFGYPPSQRRHAVSPE